MGHQSDARFGVRFINALSERLGLHLICKLRHDSKLYFPYSGEYSGKGKPRKYGEKLTLETLTDALRKSETVEKGIQTCTYQVHVWHKNFPELLNVAIIVKTNLKTCLLYTSPSPRD